MAEKQTAGRNELRTFAPKFAELNDDVLFGDVWSREMSDQFVGVCSVFINLCS